MAVVKGRLFKDERGFTLPEMMVSIMIMIVVFFALHSIFTMSLKVFSFGNNKVEATESARVGLEKMEREIRQADAFNRPSDMHLFDTWTSTQIRFGNDLDGNGVISCPNTSPTPQCEKFGYQVNGNTLGRDNISTGTTNTPSNLQPVAGHVQSLTFTYFDRNGCEVQPVGGCTTNASDDVNPEGAIDRVLISLEISVDRGIGNPGTQELVTVIDMRNR